MFVSISYIISVLALLYSSAILGFQSTRMDRALIVFQQNESQVFNDESKVAWDSNCNLFANIFLISSPSASGFANTVDCRMSSSISIKSYLGKYDWVIVIKQGKGEAIFQAYFLHGKHFTQEANFSLKTDGPIETLFEQAAFRNLLARYFFDILPIGAIVTVVDEGIVKISDLGVAYPEKALLYELSFLDDNAIWLPNVVAELERIDGAEEESNSRYKVLSGKIHVLEGRRYFLKASSGRGAQSNEIKERLSNLEIGSGPLSVVSSLLIDSLGSNYLGLRLGHSVISSNPVLSKTYEFTLFSEIRSGPLNGLRFRYDKAPGATNINMGQDEYLSWSRFALGWAFAYEPSNLIVGLLNRVDFVPNIRMVDLEASFVFGRSFNQISQTFDISAKSLIDFSVELGAEYSANAWRFRVWAHTNIPGLQFNNQGKKLTSIKGGLDIYYELYSLPKGLVVHVLAYGGIEQLSLSKTGDSADQARSIFDLSEIQYNFPIGGIGTTVSW